MTHILVGNPKQDWLAIVGTAAPYLLLLAKQNVTAAALFRAK